MILILSILFLQFSGKSDTKNMAIKVVIVDDSRLLRRILKDILTSNPEIKVIGEGRDGKISQHTGLPDHPHTTTGHDHDQ